MSAHAHALPIMTCICTRWAGGPGSVFTCMSREVYVNHDYVLVYKPAFLRYITAKKSMDFHIMFRTSGNVPFFHTFP